MKVYVSSALKGPDIIQVLSEYSEGGVSFSFVKKTGLKMEFDVAGVSGDAAIALVKKLIYDTEFGPGLYFSVSEF